MYSEEELDKMSSSAASFDFYEVAAMAKAKPFDYKLVKESFLELSDGQESVSADILQSWLTSMAEELSAEEVETFLRSCDIPTGGSFSIGQLLQKLESMTQNASA